MLEPPRGGGSNEYPQSMFWSKNKKNRYTPAYPSFTIKVGSKGVFIVHVFLMIFEDELAHNFHLGVSIFEFYPFLRRFAASHLGLCCLPICHIKRSPGL